MIKPKFITLRLFIKQTAITTILSVILCLLLCGSAYAENKLNNLVLGGNDGSGDNSGSIKLPNPLKLEPKWWKYFDIDSQELAPRIDRFKAELNRQVAQLSVDEQTTVAKSIDNINRNLTELLTHASGIEAESSEKVIPFKETYSIHDLTDLLEASRANSARLDQLNRELEEDQQTASSISKSIEKKFVAYKKLTETNRERLFIGLEIIANRLSLLVWSKDEEKSINKIKQQQALSENNKKELEHAGEHLAATEDDLVEINNLLQISKNQLASSYDRTQKLQSKTMGVLGSDALSRMNAYLYNQTIIAAEIQEAINELDYTKLQLQAAILEILLNTNPEKKYNKQVIENRAKLKDKETKKKLWFGKTITERYRNIELLQNTELEENDPARMLAKDRMKVVNKTMISISRLEDALFDTAYFNSVLAKKVIEKGGILSRLNLSGTVLFKNTYDQAKVLFDKSIFTISDIPVTLTDILRAIFIFIIAIIISRIVRKLLNKFGENEKNIVPPIVYNLGRVLHYIIIFLGIIVALSSIGIGFTNLAIVAGALSVGIGFGLQSIVHNFVSGIIILFERHIEIGDFVELESGMKGVVKDINVRSTVITTLDNLDIIIPNSELVSAKVTNFTMSEQMFRIHVPFGVAYGSDKEVVRKAVLEAARLVPVTYDDGAKRRPQCWLKEFADSSLNFELVVWVNPGMADKNRVTPGSWKSLYMWEIETALEKYGITIPFPQRDLHLVSGFSATEPKIDNSE